MVCGSPRLSSRSTRRSPLRFSLLFCLFLRALLFPLRVGGLGSFELRVGLLIEGEVGAARRTSGADREEVGDAEGVLAGERGP